jgi:hypothetical protein
MLLTDMLLVLVFIAVGYVIASFICLRVMSYQNNLDATMPSKEDFHVAFEKTVQWMADNESKCYIDNWFLWLFAREAALLTQNKELLAIVEKYREIKNQQGGNIDGWYLLEHPDESFKYDPVAFGTFNHYAQAIFYGLTGNKEAGASEFIQCQLKSDFSASETAKNIRSSCLTHQIFGLHYIQKGGKCGDPEQYAPLMEDLQAQIQELLTLDPRVGDVYLQRVLMLVWTGARNKVKPIWFRQILERQRPDGSWYDSHNLFQLVPGFRIGMGLHLMLLKRDRSGFHTTAQGLFLTALMYSDAKT